MKFRADHVIEGISLADYGEMYFDEAFNTKMRAAVRLECELLQLKREGSRITRSVRVEPQDREIPGPVAKVLGQTHFVYVEELEMDLATGEGTFRTIPSMLADKVITAGRLRFLDEGGNARRIVEGTVDVRIFGVGSVIEHFICSDVEKSYAEAAAFTRRYVAERR